MKNIDLALKLNAEELQSLAYKYWEEDTRGSKENSYLQFMTDEGFRFKDGSVLRLSIFGKGRDATLYVKGPNPSEAWEFYRLMFTSTFAELEYFETYTEDNCTGIDNYFSDGSLLHYNMGEDRFYISLEENDADYIKMKAKNVVLYENLLIPEIMAKHYARIKASSNEDLPSHIFIFGPDDDQVYALNKTEAVEMLEALEVLHECRKMSANAISSLSKHCDPELIGAIVIEIMGLMPEETEGSTIH